MQRYIVSIDWDFFIFNGGEAHPDNSKVTIRPGTEFEQEISAIHLFDWGHTERHGATLLEILWSTRFAGFIRQGLDPRVICGNWQERGCTSIDTFSEELRKRLDIDCPVMISDSHAMGIISCDYKKNDEPVDLILFDAHCDLGYSSADSMYREAKKGHCQCSTWAWHALNGNLVRNLILVYPDWRKYVEWDFIKGLYHIEEYKDRIQTTTWSEFLNMGISGEVDVLHLCRSSAWTPPWCDEQFMELVELFSYSPICLDCQMKETLSALDGCKPRVFDETQADKLAEAYQEMDKQALHRREK